MSKPVIRVENLSKFYRLGVIGGATLREDLSRWWARKTNRPDPYAQVDAGGAHTRGDIWALRDINFDVTEGEILGIIGRNGAGKSTLLKILSRITAPTSGRATILGRVGSLLEVGTGFHPELTGRENVFLNGTILGMSKSEVSRKLDEIVVFSEVEKFIDTPVKRYSSGMTVRLAFAVAAHLEPEILIVDEVLAVGDAAFQKKCIGKMETVAEQGRTILFVSHNMNSVAQLCGRVMWLDNGAIKEDGQPAGVIEQYLSQSTNSYGEKRWQYENKAPDSGWFRLTSVRIRDVDGNITAAVDRAKKFYIEIEFDVLEAGHKLCMGIRLSTADGLIILASHDVDRANVMVRSTGSHQSTCEIPGGLLGEGLLYISVTADIPFEKIIRIEENALSLHTYENRAGITRASERWPGVIKPDLHWIKNGEAKDKIA